MMIKMETTLTFFLPQEEEMMLAFMHRGDFKQWDSAPAYSSDGLRYVQFRHVERRTVKKGE